MRQSGTFDAVSSFKTEAAKARKTHDEITRLNAEAVHLIVRAREQADPQQRELRYERAAYLLQQAEVLNDSHPVTCTNEGALFCDVSILGETPELQKWAARWAHRLLAKAIHSGSEDANTFLNMAIALRQLGKVDEALEFFAEAEMMTADRHTLEGIRNPRRYRKKAAAAANRDKKSKGPRRSGIAQAVDSRTTRIGSAVRSKSKAKPTIAVSPTSDSKISLTPKMRKTASLEPHEVHFETRDVSVPRGQLEVIDWLPQFRGDTKPVVSFVDRLLLAGQRLQAKALMIEPTPTGFRVGFTRSAGEIREWEFPEAWEFGSEHYRAIVSRLMICAHQDVTQIDVPQQTECTMETTLGALTLQVWTSPDDGGERILLETL